MFCKTKPGKVINFRGNTNEDIESLLIVDRFLVAAVETFVCHLHLWPGVPALPPQVMLLELCGAGRWWGRKPQSSDLGCGAAPGTGTGHLLVLLMPGLFPEEL